MAHAPEDKNSFRFDLNEYSWWIDSVSLIFGKSQLSTVQRPVWDIQGAGALEQTMITSDLVVKWRH